VLDDSLPAFSLLVLYVLAVLVVALFFGSVWASLTALASMLAFNYFFLPPVHTLRLAESSHWLALGVFVVTAVVVGTLAGRSKRRATESEQREREAALIADMAGDLLRGTELVRELDRLAGQAAETLGLSSARIELDGNSLASGNEAPYPLEAGGKTVGILYGPADEEPSIEARHRRTRSVTSAAVSETTYRVPFASTITVSGFASMTWIRSGFTYSSWSGWVMRWTAITPGPFGVGGRRCGTHVAGPARQAPAPPSRTSASG